LKRHRRPRRTFVRTQFRMATRAKPLQDSKYGDDLYVKIERIQDI